MDDILILEVLEAFRIVFLVAVFLLKTSRIQKAIELFKECLILLHNDVLQKEKDFVRSSYVRVYLRMFYGYLRINAHTSAIECGTKLLDLLRLSGKRAKEGTVTFLLANLYQFKGKFKEAKELYTKALIINIATGEMHQEGLCYGNLANVFHSLGECAKAIEYHKKALAIIKKIGDRKQEAACYGNLGTVFQSLGEYAKTIEYHEKALAINVKIGDRKQEATCYENLGTVFGSLGEKAKAEKYHRNALAISKEISDRDIEASCYANLGNVFHSLGEYAKAKEYHENSLLIAKEIGNKNKEALCYGNLGVVFQSLDEFANAKDYYEKALLIAKEIDDRKNEAVCYGNLGCVFHSLGEYAKAKEYHEKALTLHKENGNIHGESKSHFNLSLDLLTEGNIHEAKSHLFAGIHNSEDIRSFLRDNDQLKTSFSDEFAFSYRYLSWAFYLTGDLNKALYAVELGRARALADLMSAQYSVEQQISVNQLTWVGIERIMKKESNSTCLYISYFKEKIFLWILETDKSICFQEIDVNDCFVNKASVRNVDEVLDSETFGKPHVLAQEQCEDRSWFSSNASHPTGEASKEDNTAAFRKPHEDKHQDPEGNLAFYYKLIIGPVANLLKEREIIIVPDRLLFKVPFAALKDESGKFLSENFRIRIVPSLTTLKLIQDSRSDYHSQSDALIVGDPDVGFVLYKGRLEWISGLPGAREEAKKIGRLLEAQPLLGKEATKQAVLQDINTASLIHFAAHANAERGEIALAPPRPTTGIPQEENYLLTMADISQVRLQAKLVVLSCCHSARGQIRAEGVVGIARAFLGSGARSVLVALWAIDDIATEQLMSSFYEHLVRGESASESLHQAMKWMRANGLSKVEQWAPFMLIGDNVTFDFGK